MGAMPDSSFPTKKSYIRVCSICAVQLEKVVQSGWYEVKVKAVMITRSQISSQLDYNDESCHVCQTESKEVFRVDEVKYMV